MARQFGKVRGLIEEAGLSHAGFLSELCRKYPEAAMGSATFSHKMTAKSPWNLTEIYAILDYFDIAHNRMHEYFPPNGQNEPGVTRITGRRPVRL